MCPYQFQTLWVRKELRVIVKEGYSIIPTLQSRSLTIILFFVFVCFQLSSKKFIFHEITSLKYTIENI